MQILYRLEGQILGPIARLLSPSVMPLLARLLFLSSLAFLFWNSAMTKIGGSIGGLFSPSPGAYAQIFPKAMENAGFDPSQLGFFHHIMVYAGTWSEFVIPALIVVGLFTRASALAMIGFVVVMTVVDVYGHGGNFKQLWFVRGPWFFLLAYLAARGGGMLSLDSLLNHKTENR